MSIIVYSDHYPEGRTLTIWDERLGNNGVMVDLGVDRSLDYFILGNHPSYYSELCIGQFDDRIEIVLNSSEKVTLFAAHARYELSKNRFCPIDKIHQFSPWANPIIDFYSGEDLPVPYFGKEELTHAIESDADIVQGVRRMFAEERAWAEDILRDMERALLKGAITMTSCESGGFLNRYEQPVSISVSQEHIDLEVFIAGNTVHIQDPKMLKKFLPRLRVLCQRAKSTPNPTP